MESMINEMAEKFKANLREFFMGEKRTLAEAERYFGECLSHIVTGLLPAYDEKLDREILEEKAERRKEGLSVERHGEKRMILTTLGEVEYDRTYYQTKEQEYCYPVDAIAGVEMVIPPKKNRKKQREYDTYLYKIRHLVENAFRNLKEWRGIATCYAKNTDSFLAAVQIRCIALWAEVFA